MIGGLRIGIRAAFALVLGCATFTSAARAEPLRAVHVTQVAAAPVRSGVVGMMSVGGQPVIVTAGQLLTPASGGNWAAAPYARGLPASRTIVVSGATRAALVASTDAGISRAESVGFTNGVPRVLALPLPASPLRSVQAAWEGDTLLVAGLDAGGAPRLLSYADGSGWTAQPAWPGGAPAVLSAQNGARIIILPDGRTWRWTRAAGWRAGASAPGRVIGGGPVGQAHLFYAVARGGANQLYSYSTITDAWAALGALPAGPLTVAPGRDGLLVAADGPDGLRLWSARISPAGRGLAAADVAIIAVYMLSMLGVGLYFYRRANLDSAGEFFLGNRRIPFWAAGLSMFAGTIGSVNYLAYPAKSFETDWQYLMSKVTYVGALVVVALWLAPFLRRLNLVSVYSYLEARFHLAIRLLASGLWVVLQLFARMGIILYLPALAINSITGVDIVACIVTVGVFTIVYTALGGMRAVVWTDVVQVFVLMGGALFAIGYILHAIGWSQVVETTRAFNKTHAMNWNLDPKQPTMWTFLALAVLEGILCFPRDQIVMQRVLATSSPKEASWSVLTFAVVLLPSAVLFYGIGTALFAFYRARPAALDPLLPIDAVFPTFIGNELPRGVVGLVVAGVLAAAMGVLSGIINSVATLLSVDFYERFRPARTQRQIVRFSEAVSVLVGVIGIAIAILLSRLNVHSLLDLTIELGGVFGGSFAGAYPLGIFTRRANWQGAAIGIVVSAALTLWVWALQLFHPYLYLAFAIVVTLGVGYLASLVFPPPRRSLEGLTVFTRRAPVRAG